jgi:ribonuclease G
MGKELVIASNRHETKVAILEDDQLVEVVFQRANEYSLAGSIHKGRVTRVLPGMQSAFVDIGLERDAFLYVSDFFEDNEEYDKIAGAAEDKVLKADRVPERVVERAPEPRPVEPVAAVEPPPAPPSERPVAGDERTEEGDRDRRGRRSRRRRARGRGFPESKYASFRGEEQPQAAVEAPVTAVAEPEPETASEAPSEFSVLPGESLAKYSRVSGDEPEVDQAPEAEEEAAVAVAEEPEAEAPEVVAEPAEPEAEVRSLTVAVQQAEAEPVEPEPVEPEPVEPEPVAVEAAEAEAAETESAEPDAAEEAADSEASLDAVPDQVTELPEGVIPDQPETGTPAVAEDPAEGQPMPEDEGVEPARMPVSLTATLREQGHRYMHRVSRRMRRKMRSAGGVDGAPEEVAEPMPAPTEVSAPKTNGRAQARPDRPPLPSISELLREGQEILVQIAKEPLGQKGARITSHIALPGRYVVFMPTVEHMGVSRKIASDEERMRLRRILQTHRAGMTGGFIVRTAGEGKPEDEIAADMRFLFNMWLDIRQKAEARRAPALIHHDLDLVHRILRDQMTDTFKTIWADNEEVYESVLRFVERFQPALVSRVKLYTRDTPIFDAFNVSAELEKALRPKVWLKSGGYIVINQTEALVAVDVNTGKFVGKSNRLEDTIVKTNTEAVKEIVRQIRLRDLGGIIVVDFIDMDERKNRQKVMQALEEAMRSDRAPNKILQFNDFGLVAITRKRVKQSLERTLCSPCPYCDGAGYVKSVDTIIAEILQEAQKIAKAVEGEDCTLRVHPDVAKVLKSSSNTYLEELEEILGRPVLIHSDALLQQEKFDLV